MYHFERMQLGAMKNHKQGAQGGAVPKERVRGTTEPCQIRVQGSTSAETTNLSTRVLNSLMHSLTGVGGQVWQTDPPQLTLS